MIEKILRSAVQEILSDSEKRKVLTNFINDENSNVTKACNCYEVLLKITNVQTFDANKEEYENKRLKSTPVLPDEGLTDEILMEFIEGQKKKCVGRVEESERYQKDFKEAMKTKYEELK